MALWGNNDNVGSGGLVSLNYTTRVVTGSGTTFGETGAAQEGDVIRFGVRGGLGVYFGDAVIASIAGTESLTIASTTGLSGAAIASTDFLVSELPSYTVGDSHYSELNTGMTLLYMVSPQQQHRPLVVLKVIRRLMLDGLALQPTWHRVF